MAKLQVHVYEVSRMTIFDIEEAKDDTDALTQALKKAKFSFVPTPKDCKYVAVLPSGARRDIYDQPGKATAKKKHDDPTVL